MKKLILSLLLLVAFLLLIVPVTANNIDLVSDEVGLLSDEELIMLNEKAAIISEQYSCDVAITIVKDIGAKNVVDYAMDFYEEHDFGYGVEKSGALLLLSMSGRDYAFIAYGYGNTAFTDYGKDVLIDNYVLPELKNNNYHAAFIKYLDKAAEYLSMARNGEPFDRNNSTKEKNVGGAIFIMALISCTIALITCLIWRAQMKSAVFQKSANSYIAPSGLNLTLSRDVFLRQSVVRVPIQTSSSSGGGTTVNSRGYSSKSGKF